MLFKTQKKPHVFFCLLFQNRATFVLRKSVARFHATNRINWWPGAESNCRHADFQCVALSFYPVFIRLKALYFTPCNKPCNAQFDSATENQTKSDRQIIRWCFRGSNSQNKSPVVISSRSSKKRVIHGLDQRPSRSSSNSGRI